MFPNCCSSIVYKPVFLCFFNCVFLYLEPKSQSGLLFPSEYELLLTTLFVVCSDDLFVVNLLFLFGDPFNNHFLLFCCFYCYFPFMMMMIHLIGYILFNKWQGLLCVRRKLKFSFILVYDDLVNWMEICSKESSSSAGCCILSTASYNLVICLHPFHIYVLRHLFLYFKIISLFDVYVNSFFVFFHTLFSWLVVLFPVLLILKLFHH